MDLQNPSHSCSDLSSDLRVIDVTLNSQTLHSNSDPESQNLISSSDSESQNLHSNSDPESQNLISSSDSESQTLHSISDTESQFLISISDTESQSIYSNFNPPFQTPQPNLNLNLQTRISSLYQKPQFPGLTFLNYSSLSKSKTELWRKHLQYFDASFTSKLYWINICEREN